MIVIFYIDTDTDSKLSFPIAVILSLSLHYLLYSNIIKWVTMSVIFEQKKLLLIINSILSSFVIYLYNIIFTLVLFVILHFALFFFFQRHLYVL